MISSSTTLFSIVRESETEIEGVSGKRERENERGNRDGKSLREWG